MRAAVFQARCIFCGDEFYAPKLSDFSYGEFIYSNQSGFKYFYAPDHPVWNFIESYVIAQNDLREKHHGSIIQRLIGLIADRTGKDAYQNEHVCCQTCGRKSAWISEKATGSVELDEMTFERSQGKAIKKSGMRSRHFYAQ